MPLFVGFMGLKIFEFIILIKDLDGFPLNLAVIVQKSDLFVEISVLKFATSFRNRT